jgi:hypothetical protein
MPFDPNSYRNQRASVEQAVRSEQMGQMHASQMEQMHQSQMNMLRLQNDLARSQATANAQLSQIFSTGPPGTSMPGFGQSLLGFEATTGARTQTFGGVVGTAIVQPFMNAISAGAAYPAQGFRAGSTGPQEIARAREELKFRFFTEMPRAMMGSLVPESILSRMNPLWASDAGSRAFGSSIADVYAGADISRTLANRMFSLRGKDREAFSEQGDMLPLMGVHLTSERVHDAKEQVTLAISSIQSQRGAMALSKADVKAYGVLSNELLSNNDIRNAARAGEMPGERQADLVKAIERLTTALHADVDQIGELIGAYKKHLGPTLGISALNATAATISQIGITTGMSKHDLASIAGASNGFAVAAVRQGLDQNEFARVQIGASTAMLDDLARGDLTYRQLNRFGGSSQIEAAMGLQNYRASLSQGFATKFGNSLGVLGGGPLQGDLLDVYGSIGAAYGQNPFAGHAAQQSASTQLGLSANAYGSAYKMAQETTELIGGPEEMAVSLFQQIIGENSPIHAAAEFRTLHRRSKRAKTLAKQTNVGDEHGWFVFDEMARQAGIPLHDVDPSLVADLYKQGGGVAATPSSVQAASFFTGNSSGHPNFAEEILQIGVNLNSRELIQSSGEWVRRGIFSREQIDDLITEAGLDLTDTDATVTKPGRHWSAAKAGQPIRPEDQKTVKTPRKYTAGAISKFRKMLENAATTSDAPLSLSRLQVVFAQDLERGAEVLSAMSGREGGGGTVAKMLSLLRSSEDDTAAETALHADFSAGENLALRTLLSARGYPINADGSQVRDGSTDTRALFVQIYDPDKVVES